MRKTSVIVSAIVLLLVCAYAGLRADEGMWTFDNLPKKLLKEKYDFDVTEEWAKKMQLAAVRVSTGGSGSFVSSNGLIMTNHHVGQDAVQKLSSAGRDLVGGGFVALRPESELRCQDLSVDQLISITDVTERVRSAVGDKKGREAGEARKKVFDEIQADENQRSGFQCKIETFYGGDQYCVYRYKTYADVRLVFTPEKAIASFGGDRDNFCFPRYCLDMALFRAYENGKPAQTQNYFPWSKDGAQEGELVFVSGNPGRTGRYETAAACRFFRDVQYPAILKLVHANLDALYDYANEGPEQRRQALDDISTWENERKRSEGYLEGLGQPRVFERIEQRDRELALAAKERAAEVEAELAKIAEIFAGCTDIFRRRIFSRLDGELYKRTSGVIELARELEKPEAERAPAYRGAALENTEKAVFKPVPLYKAMDARWNTELLRLAKAELGPDDEWLKACLAGRTADEVGKALAQTRVDDVAFCKELIKGGMQAVAASTDPLVVLVRSALPVLRERNDRRRIELAEPLAAATARLAELRRTILGRTGAPDANFTLRLSFGVVKGYEMGTTDVPAATSIWGLFERSRTMGGRFPYDLPPSWEKAKDRVQKDTPFNFVSTCDIIGGNSGSPVLNRAGEVVGLIFDGNIQSLSNNYCYDETTARSVSVHSKLIIEALRHVYDAGALADEMQGSRLLR
jgi:hypothetical protein